MDSDIEKMMKDFEENNRFTAAKKASDREVQKFVEAGGMDKQVLVDGAYRDKDDVDGSKLNKQRRISRVFWIGVAVSAIVLAVLVIYGVIPE